MNLMDLFIKIGVDDQASRQVASISQKLGNGLKTAAKIGTAAVAAAGTGITALVTKSVQAYADYEQLVGGVETLFKDSAKKVQDYADQAYKTANMSANQYMETVTSFSASLLQGLNGDTAKAAEIANRAIIDMSDNANKMGTDMSLIQNAYQGFAKQNYTMLDNLKLGYGGTASEMARLINDSGVLGETTKVTAKTINNVSFDKIIEAIGVIQEKMGITGTTAKESAETISGSIATAKAAFENYMVSLSNGQADADEKFYVFARSIENTAKNLKKPILTVLGNIGSFVSETLKNIDENKELIIEKGFDFATDMLQGMINYIESNKSIEKIVTFITDIVMLISKPDNIGKLVNAGISLAKTIISGFANSINVIIKGTSAFIRNIGESLFGNSDNVANILDIGVNLITKIIDGIRYKPGQDNDIGDVVFELLNAGAKGVRSLIEGIGKNIAGWLADGFESYSFSDYLNKQIYTVAEGTLKIMEIFNSLGLVEDDLLLSTKLAVTKLGEMYGFLEIEKPKYNVPDNKWWNTDSTIPTLPDTSLPDIQEFLIQDSQKKNIPVPNQYNIDINVNVDSGNDDDYEEMSRKLQEAVERGISTKGC